jgi:putative sigma-54 modulation protein
MMNLMNVEIRTRQMDATDAMRAHVTRKLEDALRRHPGAITKATLRAGDINGPKGGKDILCSLVIEGPRLGRLVAQVTDADFYVAVSRAIDKVARALDQAVRRGRLSAQRDRSWLRSNPAEGEEV